MKFYIMIISLQLVNTQLHIFIILIASCANVIVAPVDLSTISSVGMKVYNITIKFQGDCIYKS